MIRALLAIGLAAALLAASLPAVESAAADRTAAALDRDIDRLDRAGASLLAEDDAGARRIVTVSLSADSLTAASVDAFVVDCRRTCAVRYRLDTGATRTRQLGARFATPEGAVRLSAVGDHRLTLSLVRGDAGNVVTVEG